MYLEEYMPIYDLLKRSMMTCKVKILWEGHKIWKIPHLYWRLLSLVKTSGRFFQFFVFFSENLNFIEQKKSFDYYTCELHLFPISAYISG